MTDTDKSVARLEAVLDRLEALGLTLPPAPSPTVVDPDGYPGHVASGELIESAWGNATADKLRVHQTTLTSHGDTLTSHGDTLTSHTSTLASHTTSINRLWGYPIVARALYGNVATDGNGDFAISTGFAPVAAVAVGAQVTAPSNLVLRDMNAVQVVFRAYNAAGVAYGSATITVSCIILSAAGATGSLTAEPLELEP